MIIKDFFTNLYTIFIDMSVYIMLGLFIVGILHSFVDKKWITSQIGDNSFWSVVKASLLGVPLPLCSCGVVPTAVELKKTGGSNGAVVSFLISTPQTGIDSIVATWGMMGSAMAFFRAIAAFISGIVGGIFVNIFGKDENINTGVKPTCDCEHDDEHSHDDCGCSTTASCGCGESCGCSTTTSCGCSSDNTSMKKVGFSQKVKEVFTYSFGSFLDEIAIHFILGIIISALISTVIPDDFFISYGLNKGILSMLLMIVVGLPMYICSTSSIPIALTLVLKGLSPGAAFVFLFTGPVSNMASMIVLGKTLGKKITAIYISSVIVMSVLFGLLFDYLVSIFNIDFMSRTIANSEETIPWYFVVIAVIFLLLLIKSIFVIIKKKFNPNICS